MAAVAAVLVMAAALFLLWQALSGQQSPPDVALQVERVVEQQSSAFVVEFVARNQGRSAGERVKITGELRRGETVLERSEAVLNYLPLGSQRRGGLYFERDPRQYELVLRAEGYAQP